MRGSGYSRRRNARRSLPGAAKNPDLKSALNSALRQLTRRDHSVKELREKLARWYEEAAVAHALSEVERLGLMKTPEELARLWSESLSRRGQSHRRIQNKLRALDLPLGERDDEREQEKCRETYEKRFGRDGEPPSYEEKAKIYRYLLYRGFDSETINRVLRSKRDEKR